MLEVSEEIDSDGEIELVMEYSVDHGTTGEVSTWLDRDEAIAFIAHLNKVFEL